MRLETKKCLEDVRQAAELILQFTAGKRTGKRFLTPFILLVEFQPLADGEHADAYFGLLAQLESLLARPVDLVMTRAIRNPYFLEAIEPTRTLVYAA